MIETPAPTPPPGWYADPQFPGTERWWSGRSWTANVQPAGRALAGIPYSPQTPDGPTWKSIAPAVTAFTFGIISLVLNAFLLATIVAIARGVQALRRARRSELDGDVPRGRTFAWWGIGLAVAGIPMGAFQTWLVVSAWATIL
jgi:hypothetical protein